MEEEVSSSSRCEIKLLSSPLVAWVSPLTELRGGVSPLSPLSQSCGEGGGCHGGMMGQPKSICFLERPCPGLYKAQIPGDGHGGNLSSHRHHTIITQFIILEM